MNLVIQLHTFTDFLYEKGPMSFLEFRKCGLYPFRAFNFIAIAQDKPVSHFETATPDSKQLMFHEGSSSDTTTCDVPQVATFAVSLLGGNKIVGLDMLPSMIAAMTESVTTIQTCATAFRAVFRGRRGRRSIPLCTAKARACLRETRDAAGDMRPIGIWLSCGFLTHESKSRGIFCGDPPSLRRNPTDPLPADLAVAHAMI